ASSVPGTAGSSATTSRSGSSKAPRAGASIRKQMSSCSNTPIVPLADAAARTRAWQVQGLTVVFTNGVFDLLHPGHVRYLKAARAEGDVLVVGVNADASVRAIKGPSRPVHPDAERAELLSALTCVDLVLIFEDETPAAVIDALQPD